MGVLKRKEEKSETIAVRVPASLKTELEDLRKQADAAGFDLTATVVEALVRLTRQVRSELVEKSGKSRGMRRAIDGNEQAGAALANGRAA
jgi:Tfp pilus assembly PilM family ATPase